MDQSMPPEIVSCMRTLRSILLIQKWMKLQKRNEAIENTFNYVILFASNEMYAMYAL